MAIAAILRSPEHEPRVAARFEDFRAKYGDSAAFAVRMLLWECAEKRDAALRGRIERLHAAIIETL